jgi:DNA mismatch repair protein MutS2
MISEKKLEVASKTLTRLGYFRILDELANRTATEDGAIRAKALVPMSEGDAIRAISDRVQELLTLLNNGELFSFEGVSNITPLATRGARGGVLEALELVRVSRLCSAAARIRSFLLKNQVSALQDMAQEIPDLAGLAKDINRVVTDDGMIKDTASPELADMRSRAIGIQGGLRTRIDQLKNSLVQFLQDPYYTIWEDRYVLPVKIERKSFVSGILHGISRTGATVYIEPTELVEMNNKLKLLKEEIYQVEQALLADLSDLVGHTSQPLLAAQDQLFELDMLRAMADLANAWEGATPSLSEAGKLRLVQARHPILALAGKKVIPNDIILEEQERMLVISGPNAGGKSVLLSTVGLCSLLAATGIPIPASSTSILPLFSGLHVVLGDLQDIDEHLSTFTGHLTELDHVTKIANEGDLILIDEIITGTDPDQGAALAASFLQTLAGTGCRTLVTTHYQKLKALGLTDPRFVNGAVGMDSESHTPTYKFSPGLPGVSSPLEVAKSLGVPTHILDQARTMLSDDGDVLQHALNLISKREQEAAAMVDKAAEEAAAAEGLRLKRQEALERIERDVQSMVAKRYKEAVAEVGDALTEVKRIVADLQRGKLRAGLVEERRRRVSSIEERLTKKAKELEEPPKETGAAIPEGQKLKAGTEVFMIKLGRNGKIVDGPDPQGQYRVQLGIMSMRAKISDMKLPKTKSVPAKQKQRDSWYQKPEKSSIQVSTYSNASREIDLRGVRVEEGLDRLNKALDDSVLADQPELRIIHGHGTGAMKAAVRSLLSSHPDVVHHSPADRNQGGDGATNVFFSKEAIPKKPQIDPADMEG